MYTSPILRFGVEGYEGNHAMAFYAACDAALWGRHHGLECIRFGNSSEVNLLKNDEKENIVLS